MKTGHRLLALAVLLLGSGFTYADGTQTHTKSLLTTQTPASGDDVNYRLAVACNSLTSDCGTLTITDTLPAELEAVGCSVPSGFTVNSCTAQNIEIVKDSVFMGGDSFVIDISTRVIVGTAANTQITNTATSTISSPTDPANGTVDATAETVTVAQPSIKWEVKKARTSPSTSLQPTWDTDVQYRVQLCSASASGNVSITGAQMVDTIPNNAVVVNSDGGTVAGNQITWNLGDLDLATLYASSNYSSEVCLTRNYTLRYPSAAGFADGTLIENTLGWSGTLSDGLVCDAASCPDVTLSENIGIPTPGASMSKSANDVLPGAAGSPMVWSLRTNINNSNAPVSDLVVYEQIPTVPAGITAISISSGQWNSPETTNEPTGSDVRANISYSTDATSCDDAATNYTSLANNIASPATSTTYALPAGATCVRWEFSDAGADGPAVPRGWQFTTSPVLSQNTESVAGPYPVTVENCLFATYTEFNGSTGTSGPTCGTALIEEATPDISLIKTQTSGGSNVPPGQEIQYRLRMRHNQSSSTGDINNPVIADLLPEEFEFVSWDSNSIPNGKPDPNLEIIDDYNGTGRTLLRFSWASTAPANSIQIDGSAGVANATSFTETETVDVRFTVAVKAGTPAGSYTNTGYLIANEPRLECTSETPDTNDFDGDSDTAEVSCYYNRVLVVTSAAVLGGNKWIKGDPALSNIDDPTTSPAISDALCPDNGDGYTRYPCVAQTQHGGDFTYLLQITNTGNENLTNYIAYDVLPALNDTGVGEPLSGAQRGTTWVPELKEALIPADTYTTSVMAQTGSVIEYSLSENPCRPEVSAGNDESGWQATCDNDWAASVADYTAVKAFRIVVPFTDAPYWEPGKDLLFNVNMTAPPSGLPSIPGNASVFNPAWNSLAHRATQQSNASRLPTAEPRQVGIVLPSGYRLGNLVWLDTNANGIAENGELGIEGVEVTLFEDTDTTAGVSAGDTLIGTSTTDADGKYAFGGLAEGDYYLMIADPTNQATLAGLVSSSQGEEANPNDDIDNNDNGTTTGSVGALTGLVSGVVTLGTGDSEPTNETLRSDDATDDDNDAYPDALSNVSVDFGFRRLYDMGDADSVYPVSNADNGAKHQLGSNVYLGSCVDGEADGQASTDATGDDSAEGEYIVGTCFQRDDEDGVSFPELTQGETADLTIFANTGCKLNAWVDWNDDDSWQEAGDQIATDVDLVAGNNTLSITVPEDIPETPLHARFRCSTLGGDLVTGLAADGEVEDYTITAQLLPSDLELIKTASTDRVLAGDQYTYTLTLRNKGTGKAKDVIVSDQLPSTQIDYLSSTASTGSYDNVSGQWTVPLLQAGEQATLEITVQVKGN